VKTQPFTTNMMIVRVVMFCTGIALLFSVVLLWITDESQMVLVLFVCLQGFGAVALLWAGISMMTAKRIEQKKDVLLFQRRARNVLLVVGLLPLVAVICLIMELL